MFTNMATIKEEDTGPQVANLYAALKFLIDKDAFSFIDLSELNPLKSQLRSEEPSGFYKGAAVKLVVQFKLQSGLGDEGIVDEQTADALYALLKKFDTFGAGTDFVVRGTVKDTHKRPKGGLVFIAFDRDLRRWQELGRTETDPEGKFEIPYRYESLCEAEGVVQALCLSSRGSAVAPSGDAARHDLFPTPDQPLLKTLGGG